MDVYAFCRHSSRPRRRAGHRSCPVKDQRAQARLFASTTEMCVFLAHVNCMQNVGLRK